MKFSIPALAAAAIFALPLQAIPAAAQYQICSDTCANSYTQCLIKCDSNNQACMTTCGNTHAQCVEPCFSRYPVAKQCNFSCTGSDEAVLKKCTAACPDDH